MRMHKVSSKQQNINKSSNEAFMGERVLKYLTGDTSIKKAVYFSPFFWFANSFARMRLLYGHFFCRWFWERAKLHAIRMHFIEYFFLFLFIFYGSKATTTTTTDCVCIIFLYKFPIDWRRSMFEAIKSMYFVYVYMIGISHK